jgi:hypothetical protein
VPLRVGQVGFALSAVQKQRVGLVVRCPFYSRLYSFILGSDMLSDSRLTLWKPPDGRNVLGIMPFQGFSIALELPSISSFLTQISVANPPLFLFGSVPLLSF